MAYFWAGRGAFGWGEIRSRFQRFFGLATLIPGRCPGLSYAAPLGLRGGRPRWRNRR
jgi:hypothetical protein